MISVGLYFITLVGLDQTERTVREQISTRLAARTEGWLTRRGLTPNPCSTLRARPQASKATVLPGWPTP